MEYTQEQLDAGTKYLTDLGYVSPDTKEIQSATEMTSASTDQATEILKQKEAVEKKITPQPKVIDPNAKAPPPVDNSISLVGPDGQEITFQDWTINKENIRGWLGGGYQFAKGSNVPKEFATGTASPLPKTEEQTQAEKDKLAYDTAKSQLDNFSANMENDPALKRILEGISGVWASRIKEQEQSNASRNAAMTTAGFRYGSLRYGGGALGPMAGIISAQERAGMNEISKLIAMKDSSLAEARSAYEGKKWDQYAKMVDLAEKQYSESKKAVADLVKVQAEEEKKRKEDKTVADKSAAINLVFTSGKTGISDILTATKDNGLNISAEDVGKYLDAYSKQTGLGIDKLTGETKNFYQLKNLGKLPASITALPEGDQQAAYLKMVKDAETAPAKPSYHSVAGVGLVQISPDGHIKTVVGAPKEETVIAGPIDYATFLAGRSTKQVTAFNALPENDKAAIAQLVNGDALISDLVKSRGVQGTTAINRLVREATNVDPSFSINTNKIRFGFMQQWNNPNGAQGKVRNSINTALGHLADFAENAAALDSSSLKKLNTVKNILITETGDPRVMQLRVDINALATEVAAIYKGGTQPSEREIANWENSIAADFSQKQFQGVADEIAKLLTSKITATRYQYFTTMGKEYPVSLVDPDKRDQLIAAGIDPNVIVKERVPFISSNISSDSHGGVNLPGGEYEGITLPF